MNAMKKFLFSLLIVCFVLPSFAQDYGKLQLFFVQNKMEDAKKEIDNLLTNPKALDKAETHLWKFRVYSELYSDSSLTSKYPGAEISALEALDKYKLLDNSYKQLKEEGVRGLGLLYNTSFNKGRQLFNDKNWDSSFKYFSIAEQMGDFINTNNLSGTQLAIDTITVLYTAYAAQNAQKFDVASNYYKRIADLKIGGSDFEDVYRFLLDYYVKQQDTENFTKYIAVAKELYPESQAVWAQLEMNNLTQSSSLMDIVKTYQDEVAQGSLNEDKYINYAETFAMAERDQVDALDSASQVQLKITAGDAFAKAFALNPNGLYAFNVGVINYNLFGILDERYSDYRGESAALKTKRAEIEKEQTIFADSTIYWLEQAYTMLKDKTDRTKSESISLNRTVDYLANIFMWKRDKSKVGTGKDYDAYDAKFKLYDSEHNKYN